MPWNTGVSGKALTIASATDSRIRVMAGPGTGKSMAMKRRVARLLEEGIDPNRILAVTLTRNAAKELIADLRSLGVAGCEKAHVGTLHGYCLKLLRKSGVLSYLNRSARLIMQFEDRPLLADLVKTGGFGSATECGKRIKAFEAAWARLQNDTPGWPNDSTDKRFHGELIGWMKFHQSLRVGELVPLALDYLKNNPACDELNAYDHVVVDEYQDLNKAEQELINLLVGNGHCAIVGDEDQSIYSFRHAHPEGIHEFSQRHPTTRDERLDECRRCPRVVVELADELIKKNHPPSSEKRLVACPTNSDGRVEIVQWNTLPEEVSGIVSYIKKSIENGRKAEEFMILCPSRDIGGKLRSALRDATINAHSFYAENALDDREAQEAFSFLTLLVDPDDRVALRFLLGSESSTWLNGQYAILRKRCEISGESPRAVLDQLQNGTLVLNGMTNLVSRYQEIQAVLSEIASLAGRGLVDRLFPSSEEWAKSVREILGRFLDEHAEPKEIHEELVVALTQPEMPVGGEFVRIMSLHKSKGLASPIVIVVACVQGIVPRLSRNGSTPDETRRSLEEQRRLFYVAMTRAREHLVLSSAITWPRSMALGMGVQLIPREGDRLNGHAMSSQFLSEIGTSAPIAVRGEDFLNQD